MKGLSSRGFDGDARFTFLLSLLTGAVTLGISHLYVFYRVRKCAKICCYTSKKISAIAVPGHQLENGNITTDYQSRLDRAATLYTESENDPVNGPAAWTAL